MLISVGLPLALAFIMFSLGLGLVGADFKRVLTQPLGFLVGAMHQIGVLPVVAFILVKLFGIDGQMALGIMILSLCPGGVTSNMISKLANADVALSVTLTAVISLASMFTVPVFLTFLITHFAPELAANVDLTRVAISMFLITVLPITIGMVLRRLAPALVGSMEKTINTIATVLFVVIVLAALAANWDMFINNLATLAPILLLLCAVLFFIGYKVSDALGFSKSFSKTIAIETGIQNSTLGIAVTAIIVGAEAGISVMAVPIAVYGILMYVVALPAVALMRRMSD